MKAPTPAPRSVSTDVYGWSFAALPSPWTLGCWPAASWTMHCDWTRLSCHRFVANRVRLSLFVLAYNLGNFLRRLCLPKAVRHWSLRSVQVKLIKMGGRLVRHSRLLIFQLSEVSVPRSYRPVIAGAKLSCPRCRFLEGCSRECWIVSAGYRRRQAEGGYNHDLARGGERSRESACLQCGFTPLAGARRRQRWTRNMVHGKNRSPYRIDRRLTGLAGPEYDATISFGLPFEPEDSQYGKYRIYWRDGA